MGKISISCHISYDSEKQQKDVDLIIKQLKSEGWRMDGPPIHKPGINCHFVMMKRGKNGFKIRDDKGNTPRIA